MDELDQAIEEGRLAHGKKSLPPDKTQVDTREIKQSTTDPDSGYMVRDTKPKGFFYLDHRTVDSLCNIITDVHVTAGNVHDAVPYLERLDRIKNRFNFVITSVGVDTGYFTSAVYYGLEERHIYAVMGYRRPNHKKGFFYKREYKYDAKPRRLPLPTRRTVHLQNHVKRSLSSLRLKRTDLPSMSREASLYNQPKIGEDHHTPCLGG